MVTAELTRRAGLRLPPAAQPPGGLRAPQRSAYPDASIGSPGVIRMAARCAARAVGSAADGRLGRGVDVAEPGLGRAE
jgi:hypothetical protein